MKKPQNPSGTLRDFLQEVLRKLTAFEEGWLTLQRGVVDELVHSKDPLIDQIVKRFGTNKIFLIVRKFWHRRFRKHLDLEPPQESVLCAFGEVQDNVLDQAGLTAFLDWAGQHPAFNQQACQTALSKPGSLKEVESLSEAVAAIAHSLLNPPALKTTVADAQLRSTLRREVNTIPSGRKCLGGAPAIIADVLAQLGLQRVHIFSMYHSDAIARLYRGQPQRLDLNSNPPQLVCVNHPGEYLIGGTSYSHPTRNSDIFICKKGYKVSIGNQTFAAKQDDRIIFRVYKYIEDHSRQWGQVKIRMLQNGALTPRLQGPRVDPDEWPAPRGFVRWRVNNGVLELEFLDETPIRQTFNYDYIILNAPGLASFRRTDPLEHMEVQSLLQQLEWISEGPTKIHLEISGGADPRKDRIQPFAQSMKGLIHSVGINDGELLQLTALPDYDPPLAITAGASAIYQRYERALRLAQELDIERLYVHGNDVDLILRKGGSSGEMRTEIQADLFAKGIVVLAVLQRSVHDWHGYLQADYAIAVARDMIKRAWEELDNLSQQGNLSRKEREQRGQTLSEAQDAFEEAENEFRNEHFDEAERKAKEAQGIIEREFGIPAEPSSKATLSISPILLARSFKNLFWFAYDYVRFTLGKNAPHSASGLTKEGEEIFQRIVETGYYATRDPKGYSVAVVPVMWPELPIEVNPTGAGDICSGVTAVYSGF